MLQRGGIGLSPDMCHNASMTFFDYPAELHANPHYYDYIYAVLLNTGSRLELVYGESQGVRQLVRGRFTIRSTGEQRAELRCTALIEYDPASGDVLALLPDFSVAFNREEGAFAFSQETPWRVEDREEAPCLLYHTRYVFERDPFSCLLAEDERLDPLAEDTLPADRLYYLPDDGRRLPLRELRLLGIDL